VSTPAEQSARAARHSVEVDAVDADSIAEGLVRVLSAAAEADTLRRYAARFASHATVREFLAEVERLATSRSPVLSATHVRIRRGSIGGTSHAART
jgi:hypothetical protein